MVLYSELFLDGIISITATCFYLIIPAFLSFALLLSHGTVKDENLSFLYKALWLLLMTVCFLLGIYAVYFALSYPTSLLTGLYLEHRRSAGIFAGLLLIVIVSFQLLNKKGISGKCGVTALILLLAGLLVSSSFAPCIREKVAAISKLDDFRFVATFFYIAGVTLPFFLLSFLAFLWKIPSMSEERLSPITSIGLIVVTLIILSRAL